MRFDLGLLHYVTSEYRLLNVKLASCRLQ